MKPGQIALTLILSAASSTADERVAGAAMFLASDDSEFVTGEEIVVDGGLTAAGPELSRKFPKTSGRNSHVAGVTKGSTGEPPEIKRF